jgi:hypothetical protein
MGPFSFVLLYIKEKSMAFNPLKHLSNDGPNDWDDNDNDEIPQCYDEDMAEEVYGPILQSGGAMSLFLAGL